jgi:Ca-activated chloride channel homolog
MGKLKFVLYKSFFKVVLLMKGVLLILLLFIFSTPVLPQYYIKGEVKGQKGNSLQNVNILVHSTNMLYKSGTYGGFGITSPKLIDSLTFSLDGYETVTAKINAAEYLRIQLKALVLPAGVQTSHLNSFAKDINNNYMNWSVGNESYSALVENSFIKTSPPNPITFTSNTNQASYSNIRRFLNNNDKVPPDAVRIEEMLNYFNFNYTQPGKDSLFKQTSYFSGCPWNDAHKLLLLNICARKINLENIPAGNLVFLIDASGSMDMPNKLPLLKSGLRLLIKNLRSIDTISIVAYGGTARIVLEGVSGAERQKIETAVENIHAEGDTPGEAGIRLAYEVANRRFIKGGNNRIILASDGDFNNGKSSEEDLEKVIGEENKTGIYLTCLGVGMGNYKDSKLSVLGQKGNGDFAYLDNEAEAGKVLMTEFTRNLYAVADKVYIKVFMNPSVVSEYRLIGYDNNKDKITDSTIKIEGGEIGSGHSMIALFEIIPKDTVLQATSLAGVEVHYSLPGQQAVDSIKFNCPAQVINYAVVDSNFKKAAGIALFGMKLRESVYIVNMKWKKVESFAKKNFNTRNPADAEFISLVEIARKIYDKGKRKKGL